MSAIGTLSWCLLHSLWQGALLALGLALALRAIGPDQPQARYRASLLALLLLAAAPLLSLAALGRSQDLIASGPPSRLPELVVLAWIIGASWTGLRLFGGALHLRALHRRATPLPGAWSKRCAELAARAGVGRAVELLGSAEITVPLAFGVLRPVVLFPLSALSALTEVQLEAILCHELAHLRRYDFLVNLGQLAVETLFFFNPAARWISRQIRVERELCCDDLVVELLGDPLGYARALERLESARGSAQLALAATGGSLMFRIQRLLDPRPKRRRLGLGAGALALLLSIGASVPLGAEAYASWRRGPHLLRPVQGGTVSLAFGKQPNPFTGEPYFHQGIDLTSPPGAPVRAPLNGVVRFAASDGERGNVVILQHGSGLESRFHHLGAIAVKVGQTLSTGQVLGTIGTTGKITGPHLHLELRQDGTAVDPAPLLQEAAPSPASGG
ncbi:MAG: M23/M56 family metallopeptidase [Myxococcota bacterium]